MKTKAFERRTAYLLQSPVAVRVEKHELLAFGQQPLKVDLHLGFHRNSPFEFGFRSGKLN